jgi:flagellar L-ring protein precursor FlgH
MKLSFILIFSIFLSSCASFVQKFHNQIDRDERSRRAGSYRGARNPYLKPGSKDRRPIDNPVTLNGVPGEGQLPPKLQRDLEAMRKRRTKSSDLVDNSPSNSLWDGSYDGSFLFIKQNVRRPGDIVIIDVLSDLKEQIQIELKRAFPLVQRGQTATEAPEAPAATTASADATDAEKKKVHDKISTQVIEEINKDYLLLRGRKEVMFRKKKRFIEIQALVPKKAITEANSVNSDRIIEPKIYALRYGL